MFSTKKKLDSTLKNSIENKFYKSYRCIIYCSSLLENIEKKIKSYKGSACFTIPLINCICAELSSSLIERLLEYPQVQYISLDSNAHLCGSSVFVSNGITHVERYKLTGKTVCIGIIDTGTYPHLDLLSPTNKILKFIDLINNLKYPYDDHGHGTFVSGIICGSGSSSKGMYRGVAEGSSIFSIKAFNSLGKGYISNILYGLNILIDESEILNIKVILLPFEIENNDKFILSLFEKIFEKAVSKGISIVVPSGHNGNNEGSICGIATLSNCITVGGLDTTSINIKPYKYSSSGPFSKLEKPDLSAAAVNICSLNTNPSFISERSGIKLYPETLEKPYTVYTGTSCSAAFISGVVALLYENNPSLKFKDVLSLLKVSCTMHNFSKHMQGSGSIDFEKIMP